MTVPELIKLIEVILWPSIVVFSVIWLRKEIQTILIELTNRIGGGAGFKTPFLTMDEKKKSEIGSDFLKLFESNEYIIIDSTHIFGKVHGKRFRETKSKNMPVWVFLHKVRIQLEPKIQPYTYSKEWFLYCPQRNIIFKDIGVNRPSNKTGDKFDNRSLKKVEIYDSQELWIVKPNFKPILEDR
jgi:hypothetical protein